MKIDVLDHGFVRLVDSLGSDLRVVQAARVSYNADWRSGADEDKDAKLIKYLWANSHTSPFEHVIFTFEVKAPILVFRQWHRHRTQSYSEISARYTELDEGYYIPAAEQITTQSISNKQMRTDIQHPDAELVREIIDKCCLSSFVQYRNMLTMGVPRELARSVLPVNAYSRMFVTMNCLNLMRFLKLRMHSHSQYEIRVYADAMFAIASAVVPITMAAFKSMLASS